MPRDRRRLKVSVGRWQPDASVSVQWLAGGDPVAGATDRSFTPTLADKWLSVRVTATSRGFIPGS